MGLIVATAGPAAADLPNDTELQGNVTGDVLRINDVDFDIGGGEPNDCNPSGDGPTTSSTVGTIQNGEAQISDVDIQFPAGDTGETFFGNPICAQIVLVNSPGGTQTGQATDDHGSVAIDNPDIVVKVVFSADSIFFPSNCRIDNVDLGLGGQHGTDPIDSLAGDIGDENGHWLMELDVGSPFGPVGSNDGFRVPTTSGCGTTVGNAINNALGLPTHDTGARFVAELES